MRDHKVLDLLLMIWGYFQGFESQGGLITAVPFLRYHLEKDVGETTRTLEDPSKRFVQAPRNP